MTKIGKAGIYDIPLDEYHHDCCDGPSISASGLVEIERTCPAKFWVESYLNPERPARETKGALALGDAAHALVLLGEAAFRKQVAVMPADMTLRTNVGKAWVNERLELGLTVIKHEEYAAIRAMADAVTKHPMASKAFTDGAPERSLIWQDSQTGVWLKSRPDWLPNQSRFVPNYKTAVNAKPIDFAKNAFNLGYHQGAALCMDGLAAVKGLDDPRYYFVVQEKEPPYLVSICTLKDEDIEWARMLNRRALDVFARCLETGQWPGYADDVVEIEMPRYIETRLERRHEQGEFAQTVIGG